MPEYLTPGVYVEETSFRSKSIEGVSTSTTAFVGPSRKGPFIDAAIVEVEKQDTPELVTSFGDFERIYGGLEDLSWGPNYLAHAVRAYFDNGGARLYVARVTSLTGTGGRAASASIISTLDPNEQAGFIARFPGDAGNGAIEARLLAAPATRGSMDRAPVGTMLRVGGNNPEQAARLEGTVAPPFFVPNNGELRLTVGGADSQVAFKGQAAEVFSDAPLDAAVDLDETATPANKRLTVAINGVTQSVTLPTDTPQAPIARERIVDAVNRQIVGWGYARLTGAADGPANRLVIGTERKGSAASVSVQPHGPLKFAAPTSKANAVDGNNNVRDLAAVTADEVNALLTSGGINASGAVAGDRPAGAGDDGPWRRRQPGGSRRRRVGARRPRPGAGAVGRRHGRNRGRALREASRRLDRCVEQHPLDRRVEADRRAGRRRRVPDDAHHRQGQGRASDDVRRRRIRRHSSARHQTRARREAEPPCRRAREHVRRPDRRQRGSVRAAQDGFVTTKATATSLRAGGPPCRRTTRHNRTRAAVPRPIAHRVHSYLPPPGHLTRRGTGRSRAPEPARPAFSLSA